MAAKKSTASKSGSGSSATSAAKKITEMIDELDDWRGELLGRIRKIITEADSEITEEWKYRGTPVWYSEDGMVCTGEVYKKHVKLTFPKGASLDDPDELFNGTKGGSTWRAIDLHEGDKINKQALTRMVKRAIKANQD